MSLFVWANVYRRFECNICFLFASYPSSLQLCSWRVSHSSCFGKCIWLLLRRGEGFALHYYNKFWTEAVRVTRSSHCEGYLLFSIAYIKQKFAWRTALGKDRSPGKLQLLTKIVAPYKLSMQRSFLHKSRASTSTRHRYARLCALLLAFQLTTAGQSVAVQV